MTVPDELEPAGDPRDLRVQAYVAGALRRAQEEIEGAQVGDGVNGILNRNAHGLFQLLYGGLMPQHTPESLGAALEAWDYRGNPGDHRGIEATRRTIRSAREAAENDPRHQVLVRVAQRRNAGLPEADWAPAGAGGRTAPSVAVRTLRDMTKEELKARERMRREVRRELDAEDADEAFAPPPYVPTLADELDIPDDPVQWRIEGLWPMLGNIVLAARMKAGKTTMLLNLLRALADGEPFLGRYAVQRPSGRIAILNYELSREQFRVWLRQAGIRNLEQISVLNLRGFPMPLQSPKARHWLTQWLRESQAEIAIPDPWGQMFQGRNENDNSEVREHLRHWEQVKLMSGVSCSLIATHIGNQVFEPGQERARGASALSDWADALWTMTRDEQGDTRYFRAYGRDVDVPEAALDYSPEHRRLRISASDRAKRTAETRVQAVLAALMAQSPMSQSALEIAVRAALGRAGRDQVKAAIETAAARGLVDVERDGAGPIMHTLSAAGRSHIERGHSAARASIRALPELNLED